jgi:hypothetical protein
LTKIIEQLMEEVRLQKQVKDSSDFQEFSNLEENRWKRWEEVAFTSSILIRELLKKLSEYLRLQWGQHMVQTQQFATWVNEQNDVISKVEVGNEAWPMEVKNGERNKNYNSGEVSNNNKECSICLRWPQIDAVWQIS